MTWHDLPQDERTQLARRLTPKQLDVYRLRLNHTSYEHISWLLNISIRTVRTHEHRAKQIHQLMLEETEAA